MEPKPKGGIHTMVRVTDQAGNEYVCPLVALRHPSSISEDEKARCEPYEKSKPKGVK